MSFHPSYSAAIATQDTKEFYLRGHYTHDDMTTTTCVLRKNAFDDFLYLSKSSETS